MNVCAIIFSIRVCPEYHISLTAGYGICDSHCAFVLLAWVNFVNGECDFDSRLLGVLCKIVPSFIQRKFILSLTGMDI